MKTRRLRIIHDAEHSEVRISGNAEGLKYLADACLAVIGHDSPAGHWHLMDRMHNVEEGSIDAVVEFVPDWD